MRRLTQEELAERAGLSYKFVGEVERGQGNPTVETLVRLSKALQLEIGDLFASTEPRQPTREPYRLSARELQMVREAVQSLGDVIEHLDSGPYQSTRRNRRRS